MGRFGRRRNRRRFRKPSLLRRILTNRRKPNSRWVFFSDMVANAREEVFCFFNRVPRGAWLKWDGKTNKIRSYETRRRY
jgi:hypothetical protein